MFLHTALPSVPAGDTASLRVLIPVEGSFSWKTARRYLWDFCLSCWPCKEWYSRTSSWLCDWQLGSNHADYFHVKMCMCWGNVHIQIHGIQGFATFPGLEEYSIHKRLPCPCVIPSSPPLCPCPQRKVDKIPWLQATETSSSWFTGLSGRMELLTELKERLKIHILEETRTRSALGI